MARRTLGDRKPAKGKVSHARRLGIDLGTKRGKELFRWFLACLLFGKPIERGIAERAYRGLVAAGLCDADAILRAAWSKLIRLLDRARYVCCDFSTASKLLEVSKELKRGPGQVKSLVEQTHTAAQLSRRLQEFKQVGPVTARIFLGEVRPIWFREKPAAARNGKAV